LGAAIDEYDHCKQYLLLSHDSLHASHESSPLVARLSFGSPSFSNKMFHRLFVDSEDKLSQSWRV
jgi:hypothetical protein